MLSREGWNTVYQVNKFCIMSLLLYLYLFFVNLIQSFWLDQTKLDVYPGHRCKKCFIPDPSFCLKGSSFQERVTIFIQQNQILHLKAIDQSCGHGPIIMYYVHSLCISETGSLFVHLWHHNKKHQSTNTSQIKDLNDCNGTNKLFF
jgi:hypothetical protein